jgi:hypothetical protein
VDKKKTRQELRNAKDVFNYIYERNMWGNAESVSGPGSTLEYTENIRKELPILAKKLDLSVILDAPCGDYNWFGAIDWKNEITYIGGDIVEPLIKSNDTHHANDNISFICLDVVNDVLPKSDLWLCRDCLFHLPILDIMLTLDNFLRSDIRYLLTSTHPACSMNSDITTGAFRRLNLDLPPFSLCKPITMLDDWIEGYPLRMLALWEREELRKSLASNQLFQQVIKMDSDHN